MTGVLDRVVVVGASLAGLRAAETLRSAGFDGDVTVIGAEPHRPYDRPPLSKKLLLGEWEPDRIRLRPDDAFDELDVGWRFGVAATGLDIDGRLVHLSDGTSAGYDGVVIATGAACRRLPDQGDHPDVHELRTLDDSLRLREQLSGGGRSVVVIGAGFIGLEVAASARAMGNEVTVLEAAPAPLTRALGAEMGQVIGALHEAEGVDVRCGVRIDRLVESGVLLADGGLCAADVVVVGIGVAPEVEWLEGSGLELRDGVVCGPDLAAAGAGGAAVPGVFAAGDVARWVNPLFGEEMRVEHWTNAAEQGAIAASNLLAASRGEPTEPYAPVPFFWSDQFGHRIQFLGRADGDDDVAIVAGSVDDHKFLALYGRAGRLRGVLGLNAPRWVMKMRGALLDQVGWDDARSAVASATS